MKMKFQMAMKHFGKETDNMKLDYQIHEVLNNHWDEIEPGKYCYDQVRWEIWISNESLLREINGKFHLELELETVKAISKDTALEVWHYVDGKDKICGTFGTKYLNDLVEQLFDKKS